MATHFYILYQGEDKKISQVDFPLDFAFTNIYCSMVFSSRQLENLKINIYMIICFEFIHLNKLYELIVKLFTQNQFIRYYKKWNALTKPQCNLFFFSVLLSGLSLCVFYILF